MIRTQCQIQQFGGQFDNLLFSRSVLSGSLRLHELQHAKLPCPSLSPGVNEAILFSVTPCSFCLQSFPASGSFPITWLFPSGVQSIGASASVLLMNIQDWSPLGLTGLISLLSKELSRVFSSTTVQKHQFFNPQSSLWSISHIHTWLLEKP